MKWLRILALAVIVILWLMPLPMLADSSADVTVTATGHVEDNPGPPQGLTLTYISDYEVGISWTKGAGALNTMIRGAVGRTPESRTDGYLVYYGDGTNCSDTGVSLDETAAPVYYRAWSENAESGWEEEGVSDFLEGMGVTILAIAIIVLGLTITGFVRKSGPLMLAGSLGWVLFAFLMYGQSFANPNMSTGILMFGGAMALVCAIMAYTTWTSGRRSLTPEDEQDAYRKKVLKITKRGK